MKNIIALTSLALSISLLSACGGGSSNSNNSSATDGGSGSSNNSGSTGGTAGVNPITPLTSSKSQTYTVQGKNRTSTLESGFDGSIEAKTESKTFNGTDFVIQTIQLANGIPSLNVADLQKTEAIDITCDNGISGKLTRSYDYSSGNVVTSGTSSRGNISCTSTFQSILPTTITDETSIDILLQNWGDDDNLNNGMQSGIISSTCPQDNSSDELNNLDPTVVACTGSVLTNYTVTDDNNGIHKLSTKIIFDF